MENQKKVTVNRDDLGSKALISEFEINLIQSDEKLTADYKEVLALRLKQEKTGIRQIISSMKEAEEQHKKKQEAAGTTFAQNAEDF